MYETTSIHPACGSGMANKFSPLKWFGVKSESEIDNNKLRINNATTTANASALCAGTDALLSMSVTTSTDAASREVITSLLTEHLRYTPLVSTTRAQPTPHIQLITTSLPYPTDRPRRHHQHRQRDSLPLRRGRRARPQRRPRRLSRLRCQQEHR